MTLQIAIAQLDFTVGDMAGNARRIIDAAHQSYAQGARLLLTPELSVCGGHGADDLLLRPSFIAACGDAVQTIARATAALHGMAIVAGHPAAGGDGQRHNAASVIGGGGVIASCAKRLLPDCQAFDERRYFTPGQDGCVFQVQDINIGLLIGEDAWLDSPAQLARQAGAGLLAVIGATPFRADEHEERVATLTARARSTGLPLVYAHAVGGQDGVVYDGRSFAIDTGARLAGRASAFAEELYMVNVPRTSAGLRLRAGMAPERERDASLWDALVMGLRGYVRKNGFPGVLLGLSGGIDSALVLALAVDALGKEQVRALMLPSPYTAAISLDDAREMARRLGVRYDELSILPQLQSFEQALAPLFDGKPADVTEENLQARIRGVMLMALSNKHGLLLLTTGNKSEYATGYCTMYGDMCGGFAPIKDVLKTTVFGLARWRNAHDPYGGGANPIPERIITRAPSAELRHGQTDQDSLPPYAELDAIIERHMESDLGLAELTAAGFSPGLAGQVINLIAASEFKRQQSAPGTLVTRRGFGRDWRYPVTNKFRS